jgi:GT2 family glycosyltransferase
LSPNDSYARHVVTAVIVAHDGAAWLPNVIDALLGQTRPVQRVVAVDTGSRDRSGAVLAERLGQQVVFGMDRRTGYAAAVARAVTHRSATVPVTLPAGVADSERVEWLWLLHDDSEPAPDALEQLLRGATETKSAAVLGPKVMDWADRQVILEAGMTIDTAGRRITGIEPREVDQGQHDGDDDTLAVSSPGMLVRRDVWEKTGGFDPAMALFREDTDFCWRVHAAGFRVRVITDAIVYHVEATARRRRSVSVARRPARLNRANALTTLLGNLPGRPAAAALAGNLGVSLLRTIFFLIAKRPQAALDEMAALGTVFGHPLRLLRARRRRAPGRRAAYARLRADLPAGRSARVLAEWVASALSKSTERGTSGSHHASEDPSDDDSLLVDSGLTQRILTSPAVLLFAALAVISLVAGRSLLAGGPLGGGALTPAAGGASGLWHTYLQSFHPLGTGSATTAPPYLAVVAALSTVLGGKPWLAVDVLLLGCAPLSGLTAYFAARRVTKLAVARVWAAATYALLPVALGAVAGGRIGAAAVVILLPLVALAAARIFTQPPKLARRAAWATGLGVAVCAAFVPLIWVIAVAAAAVAAVSIGRNRGALINLGITAVVPPVLLFPWVIRVVTQPALLMLEAGIQAPGLATPGLPARSLLLLSPGGPGVPVYWVTGGILVAALAALLAGRRRVAVLAGWGAALVGLAAAVASSRAVVLAPGATLPLPAWPGPALAVAAIGLLVAAVTAADSVPQLLRRVPGQASWQSGLSRAPVAVLLLVALSAPVLAAAFWVTNGAGNPLTVVRRQVVPVLVAVSSNSGLRLRTLVLRQSDGHISYTVLRGAGPSLGEPDLAPDPVTGKALDLAVATLVAPSGGDAADQAAGLAAFDIGYVLMPSPDPDLARLMDGVAGLRPVSSPPASGTTPAFELWRLAATPARVRVVQPDGTITPVPSGKVGVNGAAAPEAGGTLEMAEPAGGWTASLNGHALTSIPSPAGAWAQAFRLPPGGGKITISRPGTQRDAALLAELLLLIVVGTLALPGIGAGAAAPAGTRGRRPDAAPETGAPGTAVPEPRRGAGRAARVPATAGAGATGRAAGRAAPVAPALSGTAPGGTAQDFADPAGAATGAVDPAAVAGTAVIGAAAGAAGAGQAAAAGSRAGGRAAAKGRGRGKSRAALPGRRGRGRAAADATPQDQTGQRGAEPGQRGRPGAGPARGPGQPAPAGAGAWATPPRAAWPDNQPGGAGAGYPPRGYPDQAGQDGGPAGRRGQSVPGQSIPGQSIPGQPAFGQPGPGQHGSGQHGSGLSSPGRSGNDGYPDYGIEYGRQDRPSRSRRAAGPRPGESVPGQQGPGQQGPGQQGPGPSGRRRNGQPDSSGQPGYDTGGQPGYDTGGQPRYRPDGDQGYPSGGPGGHGAPPAGRRRNGQPDSSGQPGYDTGGQPRYRPGDQGYDPSGGPGAPPAGRRRNGQPDTSGQPGYDTGGQPRYRPDGDQGYGPGYPAGGPSGPGGHGAPPPGRRRNGQPDSSGQPGYDTGGQPPYRPDGDQGYDPDYPSGRPGDSSRPGSPDGPGGPGGHGAPPPGYRPRTAYQPGYEPAGQSAYQPGYEPAGYRDPSGPGGYPDNPGYRSGGPGSRPPGYPPRGDGPAGPPPARPDESRWPEDGQWSGDSWRTGSGPGQDPGYGDHSGSGSWDAPSPSGRPPAPASPSAWPENPAPSWPGGDPEATSQWPAADEDNGEDRW